MISTPEKTIQQDETLLACIEAHAALAKIQQQLRVPKDQFNKHGKYNFRNAESIMRVAKPFLPEGSTVTMDDDAIAVDSLLENIVAAFEEIENVGVVGGKIVPIWEIALVGQIDKNIGGRKSMFIPF